MFLYGLGAEHILPSGLQGFDKGLLVTGPGFLAYQFVSLEAIQTVRLELTLVLTLIFKTLSPCSLSNADDLVFCLL